MLTTVRLKPKPWRYAFHSLLGLSFLLLLTKYSVQQFPANKQFPRIFYAITAATQAFESAGSRTVVTKNKCANQFKASVSTIIIVYLTWHFLM
jgi:hypothetical protein